MVDFGAHHGDGTLVAGIMSTLFADMLVIPSMFVDWFVMTPFFMPPPYSF